MSTNSQLLVAGIAFLLAFAFIDRITSK